VSGRDASGKGTTACHRVRSVKSLICYRLLEILWKNQLAR